MEMDYVGPNSINGLDEGRISIKGGRKNVLRSVSISPKPKPFTLGFQEGQEPLDLGPWPDHPRVS
jgi:hypothetical protein